jgi:hypothetical protein
MSENKRYQWLLILLLSFNFGIASSTIMPSTSWCRSSSRPGSATCRSA